MKTHFSTTTKRLFSAALITICVLALVSNALARAPRNRTTTGVDDAPAHSPQVLPSLVRQVIHNKGNLVTTVDNWGYIGGYDFISPDYPSGEWPKNSQHGYLAELKYWMGAINGAGDTIVANSEDDFQPMPSFRTGASAYDILFSTDTNSFDYDPSDTVGAGIGSPAQGWRVWNSDSANWVYDLKYSPTSSTFVSAGPVALQESHYRFDDGARGFPALGLEVSQTIYQWNYCYNEDFLFVVLDITNNSLDNYNNFAFGLYLDFDVGGFYAPTGENGRLGDVVEYDTTESIAWTSDVNGFDAGWNAPTGVMGTKLLQTPNNLGMNNFRTGLWDMLPTDPDQDGIRYELLASNQFDTPLPPDDQYYIMCTNGVNLPAGATVRVVYALVAGEDEADFRANADLAQTLYDNYFVGPEPPPPPTLSARPGTGRAYLNWDNVAETFVDPLSGEQDFRGYKLYRSSNLGQTWGKVKTKGLTSCQSIDYDSLAVFRISQVGEMVPHTFVDDSVTNGVEYWYCLSAFDAGDTSVPIDPLQNSFGAPGVDRNVVKVIPSTNPAGYYSAQSTISRLPTIDTSHGAIWPVVVDPAQAGKDIHKVVFYEDDEFTYWALIDSVTGDTVLKDQNMQFAYEQSVGDSLAAFFPVAKGMQVAVFNGLYEPESMVQTAFSTPGDTTLTVARFYGTTTDVLWEPGHQGSDKHFRASYEVRFTAGGSQAYDVFDGVTPISCPFEIWNITTNQRCHIEIFDRDGNGQWDAADRDVIDIVNVPYDGLPQLAAFPTYHTWLFYFDQTLAPSATTGDVLRLDGAPLNGPNDVYLFSPDGVNPTVASADLTKIKVVPNPYFGYASWENINTPSKLNFTHLPAACTIRIYTLAGEIVKTIAHKDGTGDASWDLLTQSGQQAASGMYYFHIESTYGEHLGRFALVN